jgi:hypothetical protein
MTRTAPLTPITITLILAACEIQLEPDLVPDDTGTQPTDADADGWLSDEDCDDSDPAIFPGAVEWCNGVDDDCDGSVDEGDAADATPWYYDADGDGYGSAGSHSWACAPPSGLVDNGDDCDDGDASTYPGAPEVCGDGLVNDCDGDSTPCLVSGELDADDGAAMFYGAADGDKAGLSVASAGDVDADGVGDFLIGAPYHDGAAQDAGAALLILGPVTGELGLVSADARLLGKQQDGGAGWAVAGAGDVNADGYDDILVGAPYLDTGGSEAGAALLILGPVAGEVDLSDADASLNGMASYDWTGAAVAGGGDVNGDGHADLLMGGPYVDKGGSNAGSAFLVLGPVSGELTLHDADAQLVGEDEHDGAAGALAMVGDVNGDGLADLLVGAPDRSQTGAYAGGAYLVLAPVSGEVDLGSAEARLMGEAAHDGAGCAVAGPGDVDGDGYADLLIGASGNDGGGSDAGAAYLLPGTTRGYSALSAAPARLTGAAAFDQAGAALAGAGDVDGDGLGDLLVGAPGHDAGGTDAGAAYLLLGPVEGERSLSGADITIVGERAADRAGAAVSSAGDADGDGYPDLLIGAPDSDDHGTDRGAAYLVGIVDW